MAEDSEFPQVDEILAQQKAIQWSESKNVELKRLMGRALNGEFSRGAELKYWENARLKPIHLQMVLMHASGASQSEIAEAFGYTQSRVSQVLNHPDARGLAAGLIALASDQVLDVIGRAKAVSGEMLEIAIGIARTTPDDKTRLKSAFQIMELAGYSSVKKVEQSGTVKHQHEIPASTAGRLAQALEVDASIKREVPAKFTVIAPESEAGNLDNTGGSFPPISGSQEPQRNDD